MLKLFFGLILATFVCGQQKAVTTLIGAASGNVYFTETSDGVLVTGSISGLKEGKHGFHIHVKGDLTDGCLSTAGHFNPHNVNHGAPTDKVRHVGDLGNIIANASGIADIHIVDSVIALRGEHNIIGRGVVVHSDEDDLGKGGYNDSLTTGHAGARVGCGVIGIVSETSGATTITNQLLYASLTATVMGFIRLF